MTYIITLKYSTIKVSTTICFFWHNLYMYISSFTCVSIHGDVDLKVELTCSSPFIVYGSLCHMHNSVTYPNLRHMLGYVDDYQLHHKNV